MNKKILSIGILLIVAILLFVTSKWLLGPKVVDNSLEDEAVLLPGTVDNPRYVSPDGEELSLTQTGSGEVLVEDHTYYINEAATIFARLEDDSGNGGVQTGKYLEELKAEVKKMERASIYDTERELAQRLLMFVEQGIAAFEQSDFPALNDALTKLDLLKRIQRKQLEEQFENF